MDEAWEDLIRSKIAAAEGKVASGHADFADIPGDGDPHGQDDEDTEGEEE
jgi:hypothetical protein